MSTQPLLDRRVGVLGGGQLGRMMAEAAARLGVKITALDPLGVASPTGAVCGSAVTGAFTDPAKIKELAAQVDVITVEIEHVDAAGLAAIEKEGAIVHPSPATIALIQDKLLQKQHLSKVAGVTLGEYCDVPDVAAPRARSRHRGTGPGSRPHSDESPEEVDHEMHQDGPIQLCIGRVR